MFRLREKPKIKIEPKVEKPTIGDLSSDGFKIDFSRLQNSIKQCKIDKSNIQCRETLKSLGIDIID